MSLCDDSGRTDAVGARAGIEFDVGGILVANVWVEDEVGESGEEVRIWLEVDEDVGLLIVESAEIAFGAVDPTAAAAKQPGVNGEYVQVRKKRA